MSKTFLPSFLHGVEVKREEYEAGGYMARLEASRCVDSRLFPVGGSVAAKLAKLKEVNPDYFRDVREENLYRLFEHYRQRFELFADDLREFEEFFQNMGLAEELWAWTDSIEGKNSLLRWHEFDTLAGHWFAPLREARRQAELLEQGMTHHLEAMLVFIRLGKSMKALEEEAKRRDRKTARTVGGDK